MSKRDKNKHSSSQKLVPQKKDIYNVKENLKKLRSGTGKENYETNSDVFNKNTNDKYYSTTNQDDLSGYSTTLTTDRFEKINDKFSSDISDLKEVISEHKEKVTEKLSEKLDKNDLKYWLSGVIAGILLIGSIIYALSYQNIISDIKDLKENKNETTRKIDKIDFRLEQVEKTKENSEYLDTRKDTTKGQKKHRNSNLH